MSEHSTRQIVVFAVHGEEYALPIGCVHEIIRYSKPRPVSSDVTSVEGVISLRGKIVPVFDLATRLDLTGERSEQPKIIIVDVPGVMAGVVVDEVEEVLTVDPEQFDEAPDVGGAEVDAIIKIDDRLVVLLDPRLIVVADAAALAERAA